MIVVFDLLCFIGGLSVVFVLVIVLWVIHDEARAINHVGRKRDDRPLEPWTAEQLDRLRADMANLDRPGDAL